MLTKIKKITSLATLAITAVSIPVYAAVSQEGWSVNNYTSTGLPNREVSDILLSVIEWAIIIVGLLCIIVFIYAGFLYLTAQGETDKIETAKKVLIYAVVGVVVSILGFVAVKTVNDLLVGNTGSGTGTGAGAPAASPSAAGSPSGTGAPAPGPGQGGALPVAPGMMGQ